MEGLKFLGAKAKRDRLTSAPAGTEGGHDEPLDQILADPEKQRLFGEVLNILPDSAKRDEFLQAYAEKKLEAKHQVILNQARHAYGEAMRLAESATSGPLDQAHLVGLSQMHAGFNDFFSQFAPERATELTHMQIRLLAVRRPDVLRKMMKAHEEMEKVMKGHEYKQLEYSIRDFKNYYHLTDQQFNNIVEAPAAADRQRQLQEYVSKQYGWFKKNVLRMTGESTARRGVQILDDMERMKAVKDVSDQVNVIGNALELFSNEAHNKEFMKAVMEEGLGEKKLEIKNIESAVSGQDIEKRRSLMDEKKVLKRWNDEKNKLSREEFEAGWNEKGKKALKDPDDKNIIRDKFIANLREELEKSSGQGFFAVVARALNTHVGSKVINDIEADKENKLK